MTPVEYVTEISVPSFGDGGIQRRYHGTIDPRRVHFQVGAQRKREIADQSGAAPLTLAPSI